jgi:hypothetical protein
MISLKDEKLKKSEIIRMKNTEASINSGILNPFQVSELTFLPINST